MRRRVRRLPDVPPRGRVGRDVGVPSPEGGPSFRRSVSALVAALAGLVLGCTPAGSVDEEPVVVDGAFHEWSDESIRVDGHDVSVRLELPEEITLQAATYSVALLVDVDGDPETGAGLDQVEGDTDVGAEIAIVFSPRGARPSAGGQGVAALRLLDRGGTRPLPHAALDLVFAPTHASDRFEVRFARRVDGHPQLAAELAEGEIEVTAIAVGRTNELIWRRSLGRAAVPPLASSELRGRPMVPARPDHAVRVVSWNVLFASPARAPEPFARILRALEPDVILVQEWEKADGPALERWFHRHVGGRWHALDSAGWGVAVLARWPLTRLGPSAIARPGAIPTDALREEEALRLAAAIVESPHGPIAVASVHLSCCGGAGSKEEDARRAEARLVRETLLRALAENDGRAVALRVVGGDLNLVGTRAPLDILRSGLAADGSDLVAAPAGVPGDRAVYTWRGRRGSRFSPGRLDFLLHGGGELVHGFAFDSVRLDEEERARLRVRSADSAASDHLALVLDLRPGRAPARSAQ